jgi:sugar diacid utilization regulator
MDSFKDFLQELSSNTGLKFNLISEDRNRVYFENIPENCSKSTPFRINLGKEKGILFLAEQSKCDISLLKFVIENKYKEYSLKKENLILELIEGKELPTQEVDAEFPFISLGCTLFLVKIAGDIQDGINVIRELYETQKVESIIYGNNIIVLGTFEEIGEHASSIREAIVSDLYQECIVSYSQIFYKAEDVKKAYEMAKEATLLRDRFGLNQSIVNYSDILFERLVYNTKVNLKKEILLEYRDKFEEFDKEMINTIEEFINCDMNISSAAKKLYVHRNTLIYRLDKIKKDTGLDIRFFNGATKFLIAFLVWKESKYE